MNDVDKVDLHLEKWFDSKELDDFVRNILNLIVKKNVQDKILTLSPTRPIYKY